MESIFYPSIPGNNSNCVEANIDVLEKYKSEYSLILQLIENVPKELRGKLLYDSLTHS